MGTRTTIELYTIEPPTDTKTVIIQSFIRDVVVFSLLFVARCLLRVTLFAKTAIAGSTSCFFRAS
jgi:hypothetical protein